jgi:hypothetical protein
MWARRSVSRRMNGSYVDYTAIRVWAIRRGPLCHQSSAAFRAVQGATYFVEHPHDHLGPPATARAGPHADARRRLVPRRWRVGVSRSQAHMGASREPRRLHELFWTHRRVASEVGLGLLGRQKLLLRVASRLRAVRRVSKPTPSILGSSRASQRSRVRVRDSEYESDRRDSRVLVSPGRALGSQLVQWCNTDLREILRTSQNHLHIREIFGRAGEICSRPLDILKRAIQQCSGRDAVLRRGEVRRVSVS